MSFSTRFAVISDLHVDIMPDGVSRMQAFCEAAKEQKVDFLLHLGDIQYPEVDFLREYAPESIEKRKQGWFVCDRDDEKVAVRDLLAETGLPLYGVLGNHDMDSCSKETTCKYWGMPGPYYSFVQGGVRFLALDTNFYKDQDTGNLVSYDHCNYGYGKYESGFIPTEQLRWAEKVIMASEEPCVLLSHYALGDDILCAPNRADLWAMLRRVNEGRRRVILALNGHNHVDGVSVREGVPFVSINSASNIWLGHQYDCVRYSKTISHVYPNITATAPYRDALYAIFEINESGIHMKGRRSGFVGPGPRQVNFDMSKSFFEPCAEIRDRVLPVTAISLEGKTDL